MDMQTYGGIAQELQEEADAALSTPDAPTPARRPVLAGVPPVSDQPGVGRLARPPEVEDAGPDLSSTRIRTRQDRQRARRRRLAA